MAGKYLKKFRPAFIEAATAAAEATPVGEGAAASTAVAT